MYSNNYSNMGQSAPPPLSNYEFTHASRSISWLTMHHVGKVFMSQKNWAEYIIVPRSSINLVYRADDRNDEHDDMIQ